MNSGLWQRCLYISVYPLKITVVFLALYVEVCLIPPRGLPTCGPPKAAVLDKDLPLIHPFVISQCNGMSGKFVLFLTNSVTPWQLKWLCASHLL